MWTSVAAFLSSLAAAIPILSKYFPPPTAEGEIEKQEQANSEEEKNLENGRP